MEKKIKKVFRQGPIDPQFIADSIAKHEFLRNAMRWCLLPIVGISRLVLKIETETTLVLLLLIMFLISATPLVFFKKCGCETKIVKLF